MRVDPGLRTFVACSLLQIGAVVLVIGGFLWHDRKQQAKEGAGEEMGRLTKVFLAVAWIIVLIILLVLAWGMFKKGHAVTGAICIAVAAASIKEAISFLIFRKGDGARGLGTQ